MDSYSVGSLADLITGSNTPNKPKVIKQKFKKATGTHNFKVENYDEAKPIKNKKTEVNQEIEAEISDHIIQTPSKKKSKQKQGRLDKDKSQGNEVAEAKQIKNKKKLKQQFSETDFKQESEEVSDRSGENQSNNKIKSKEGRKRKLESESEDNGVNETSPKKKKLSKNEQNAERRIKKKAQGEERVQDPEELARTIFVGNIPITAQKKKIKGHFKKYGEIETIRIRGIPVADLKTSKKVAAIKKEFNPNRSNVFCYIRFVEKESALKAEAENGALFEEHHLRVHACASEVKPDETRAIFVGNLSFKATEDELWNLFEPCGPISYVRIIRDSHSGMGKGFGYVNFKDSDAVQLALEMENVKLNDRELRITLCNLNSARKNKNNNKKKKITQPGKQKTRNTFRKKTEKLGDDSDNKIKQIKGKFQGTKFNEKNKKRKLNKGMLEKKKLVKKIAPKPK